MSQFYASIQGNRGEATRMGTKASGIDGHIRGWELGARVVLEHIDGEDIMSIVITRGSNNGGPIAYIGDYKRDESGTLWVRCIATGEWKEA